VRLERLPIRAEALGFFRFGRVAGKVIVTNDAGQWALLEPAVFEDLLAGRIAPGHPQHQALSQRGILRDGVSLDEMAERMRRKKAHVGQGPHLHIVITTLRCNQTCKYCHASRAPMNRTDTDMSLETAKRVVDLAMQSTSPYINFEFQGGEPTLNMEALELVVGYSREKNRHENKDLEHSVVTNLTAMSERVANWLVDNDVLICTSLDGPEELHNFNRTFKPGANAYQEVRRWMRYIDERYRSQGRDPKQWHTDALMTTSRRTFDHYRQVVDLYVELGLHTVHLRPLNPYGFARDTWKHIGYDIDEYLAFYEQTLDYIIELNKQGTEIVEGTAAVFLSKMLTEDDPNFVDILSPCGAGTGQVAYNYDGQLFTCDEARMASAMGDDLFQIGRAGETGMSDVLAHPTVRSLAVASLQDTLPACESCWNKPFCGVCPVHNYLTSGDVFGQRPRSSKCKEYLRIATLLVERLARDDSGQIEQIFRRWTRTRPREHVNTGMC